jgi:hypothetical protein
MNVLVLLLINSWSLAVNVGGASFCQTSDFFEARQKFGFFSFIPHRLVIAVEADLFAGFAGCIKKPFFVNVWPDNATPFVKVFNYKAFRKHGRDGKITRMFSIYGTNHKVKVTSEFCSISPGVAMVANVNSGKPPDDSDKCESYWGNDYWVHFAFLAMCAFLTGVLANVIYNSAWFPFFKGDGVPSTSKTDYKPGSKL